MTHVLLSDMRLLISGIVMALTACAPVETSAQGKASNNAFCVAPTPGSEQGGVTWLSEDAQYRPTSAEVSRRFSGTWQFVSVMTQGSASPHAERWTLRLVATDTAARTRCPIGACRAHYSFPASGQLLRDGERFDSVAAAQHRMRRDSDIDVSFDSGQNEVVLYIGPPAFDAGDLYTVLAFSDTAFAGRWESGGYFVLEVTRGKVTTLEKPAGYFCARRIGR